MTMMRVGFVLIVVLVVGTGACAVRSAASLSTDLDVVAPANASLDSAYRRGSADDAAALMTDSVVVSAEGVPDLRGRTAVRELLAQFFAGNRVEAFTLHPTELQTYGILAFERGTFAWSATPTGGATVRRNGRYSIVRVREGDGTWRIHRYLENSLPGPK